MALTTSLISYWKLDEASGDATDAHGSNTLTDYNTVGSTTGKINTARNFVASSSEYLESASNASLETGDIDFTIQAWINLDRLPTSYDNMCVVSKSTIISTGKVEFQFEVPASDNKPFFRVWNSDISDYRNAIWGSALSAGTWYHLLGWHDSVNDLVGITVNNGTPVTAATGGLAPATSSGEFSVGRYRILDYVGGRCFYGQIDEVAYWKKVLTGTE